MITILDWIEKVDLHNPENIRILRICKNLNLSSLLIDVLITAIETNDSKTFECLLEKNINLNDLSKSYSLTPLMYASQRGKVEFVEKILLKGVDANGIVNNNSSALNYTLISKIDNGGNHIKCAKLLIKAGANIESVSTNKDAHEIATMLKNEIEREKIVLDKESIPCITNEKSETCVTTDGIQVTIPKIENKKMVIKILHNKQDSIHYRTYHITRDTFVNINKEGNWQKHLLNYNPNNYIELPNNAKISYHYLPAGVSLDGISTIENYVCKFGDLISSDLEGFKDTILNRYA